MNELSVCLNATLPGDDIFIPTGEWLAGIYADDGVPWHDRPS